MALVFAESFDAYEINSANAEARGWIVGSSAVLGSSTGRLGANALDLGHASIYTGTMSHPLPAAYSTVVVGFGAKLNVSTTAFFQLLAGSTVVAQLALDSSNHVQVLNGSGTVIATGTTALVPSGWNYLELKLTVGTSGSCEVQLNAASEITSTTGNFGTSDVDGIQFTNQGSSAIYDDVYACDTSGSVNNTFLGDIRVEALFPDADGAHSDWTPNSGSTHYTQVDESSGTFPDGDTTYVYAQTAGDRDSYAFGNLEELSGTVLAVQTLLYARKDASGTKQICAVARPGSTDDDGSTATLGTNYAYYTEIRETNPDTSAAWTIADVNGSEFGVKVVT